MLKTPYQLLLALLTVFLIGCQGETPPPADYSALQAATDQLIETYVADGKVPGAEVLIVKDGETIVHEVAGMSDVEAGREVATTDIWRIASMTKPITAVAILNLKEEGKLEAKTRG